MVPDNGVVGLHADNLAIERVTVDGEPALFEVFPHYQALDSENRWCGVSSATSAADAAGSVYLSSLERELVPNLLIMCSKSIKSVSEEQGQQNSESGLHSPEEPDQVIVVITSPSSGTLFGQSLHACFIELHICNHTTCNHTRLVGNFPTSVSI